MRIYNPNVMTLTTVLMGIAMLAGTLAAGNPTLQPKSVQEIADAFVEAELGPGIAIGILDEFGRTRIYSAGTLESGGDQPVKDNTIFEIGSISKIFTAVLAHRLEQQGQLSLSDPVNVHLPDGVKVAATDGNEVTLWHLATHTSGLPREPENLTTGKSYYPFSVEQLYEYLDHWKPERAPGESYGYSNLGYGLLGHAIELNQNESYESLVQDHILRRLNMRNTGCHFDGPITDRIATPHHGIKPANARTWTRPTAGAGGIKSSVRDLMLFAKANLSDSGAPLHSSLRSCQTPRAKADSSNQRIGLGWQVIQESSEPIIKHGGATNGFRSFIALMPDRNRAVVVLTNSNTGVEIIGLHALAPDVFGVERIKELVPTYRPNVPIDYDDYVGSYRHVNDSQFTIENRNDELYARLNDQIFYAFRPVDKDLFRCRSLVAWLQFERDPNGNIKTLILKQNGNINHYQRRRP